MHFEHNTYLNSILDSFIKPKTVTLSLFFIHLCLRFKTWNGLDRFRIFVRILDNEKKKFLLFDK